MIVEASNHNLQVYNADSTTSTVTITGGYCLGCYTWPCQCSNHNHYSYWYPIPNDKSALLKAWLDGYMTDRKMSEKALKRIREKIEEFVGG